MKLKSFLVIVALSGFVVVPGLLGQPQPTGPIPSPPLTVDGTWVIAGFSGAPPLDIGPFTFSGPATVIVTDIQANIDQFEVFDNGVSLGFTVPGPLGTAFLSPPDDCDAGLADPDFSSGSFVVGAGDHSIILRTVPGSSNNGSVCIQADPSVPVPTLPRPMLALMSVLLLAAGALVLRALHS